MPKCFVPGCGNTVGVLFPKNADVKKKWLKSLELVSTEPEFDSFVCLDHFENDAEGNIGSLPKRQLQKTDPKKDNSSQNKEMQQVEPPVTEASEKSLDEESAKDPSDTCRLCMKVQNNLTSIFDNMTEKYTIIHAIVVCLFPLTVSKRDSLSKKICQECLTQLSDFFKFRQACLERDQAEKKARGIFTGSDFSDDSEDFFNDTDDDTFLQEIESKIGKKSKRKHADETEESSKAKVLKNGNEGNERSELDKKFDKVEEELLKVLEGSFSESTPNSPTHEEQIEQVQSDCEEIIIDVVNEEDTKSYKLTSTNLPIIIKPISKTTPKKLPEMTEKKQSKARIVRTSRDVLTLPSSIKVQVKHDYQSPIGIFECTLKPYLFDSEFVLADGYIYGHRLIKGDVRSLHCLYPKCLAEAIQKQLPNKTYSNEITVVKPHNHKAENLHGRKRQMFFQVMRKQIQDNKDLNFKRLYDKICNLDPAIKDLVPLKTVINELCRYGSNADLPKVKSFKQLYNEIEDFAFSKIHYTFCGPQFYQERFEDNKNDAHAILFANTEIIEKYSYSKLMYVDSSFQVLPDMFPYKLVTVLLWVHDSYYPVMFAFISKVTQEIYRQIFHFLYNNLASKLRPDEVITSFECCLYYALSEVYVDSHIGGAIFYYTQNLYMKICSLQLAKDLETNSNFRNIYYMLLMLPLLPVNTILDALNNIEVLSQDMELDPKTKELFDHIHKEWMLKVTPELFCVHNLENRINENVIAPFKKLRDLFMINKHKYTKHHSPILQVIEKVIDLEVFLRTAYSNPAKRSFARDLTSTQKKTVLRAWSFIDNHPKININNFFSKVIGYIKLMENQLWIWGFYRYEGELDENLIEAANFSIVTNDGNEDPDAIEEDIEDEMGHNEGEYVVEEEEDDELDKSKEYENTTNGNQTILMEAILDDNGQFVLQKT